MTSLPEGMRYKIQNNLSFTTGNKNEILKGHCQLKIILLSENVLPAFVTRNTLGDFN